MKYLPSKKLCEFISAFHRYKHSHSASYAASIAFGCVFQGLPF